MHRPLPIAPASDHVSSGAPPPQKKKLYQMFLNLKGLNLKGRGSERVEFGEFQFHIQSNFYIVHGLLSG